MADCACAMQELEYLKECEDVWNVLGVLNWLQALVDKSGIVGELGTDGGLITLMC